MQQRSLTKHDLPARHPVAKPINRYSTGYPTHRNRYNAGGLHSANTARCMLTSLAISRYPISSR